jgi:hypothetical protein
MTQQFWDPAGAGVATNLNPTGYAQVGANGRLQLKQASLNVNGGVSYMGGILTLLPDVSVQNLLPDQWAWDVIYLAFNRVPGLVDVKMKRGHRTAQNKANGADGAQLVSLGYNPAEVTIKIRMWTPQQLRDFETITIPTVQPRPGKAGARPVPVVVDYPSLAMWGINKLFITDIAGPERTSTPQVWEVTLTASELSPVVTTGVVQQKGTGPGGLPTSQPATPQNSPSAGGATSPVVGQ